MNPSPAHSRPKNSSRSASRSANTSSGTCFSVARSPRIPSRSAHEKAPVLRPRATGRRGEGTGRSDQVARDELIQVLPAVEDAERMVARRVDALALLRGELEDGLHAVGDDIKDATRPEAPIAAERMHGE